MFSWTIEVSIIPQLILELTSVLCINIIPALKGMLYFSNIFSYVGDQTPDVSGPLKSIWNPQSGRKSRNREHFDRAGFIKLFSLQTYYQSVAVIFTFLNENSPLDSWSYFIIFYMIFCSFHWFEKWACPENVRTLHISLDYPDTQKPESQNLWCLKLSHPSSILYLIFTMTCHGHTRSTQSWEWHLTCLWLKPKESNTPTRTISTISYPHNLQNKHAQDIGCEKHRKNLKDPQIYSTSLQEVIMHHSWPFTINSGNY